MNKSLLDYLESKKCFKLVLGANNSDYEEIFKLAMVYSSIGCRFFDIEASTDALNSLIKGIEHSKIKRQDIFICISVGVNQDPHLTKYKIDPKKCKNCLKCKDLCLQDAIYFDKTTKINEKNCIGCSKCYNETKCPALISYQKTRDWKEFLPSLFDKVDCIEFHIITDDIEEIDKKWDYLCSNYNGLLSICCDRSYFGDRKIIGQLKKMIKKAERKVIIQADGAPMSGGCNDYKTTLQTIAFVDLINKSDIENAFVIMSGGTNSKTMELARLLDVKNNGAAFGSYARKIVKQYLNSSNYQKAKITALELFKTV